MSPSLKKKLKKEKIFLIKITRDFEKIKNRKKIYNKKVKYVIGVDIKNPKVKNEFKIENNTSIKNFYKKLQRVIHER